MPGRLRTFSWLMAVLVADLHSSSVVPQGTTPAYGAPEVLRSLQKQYEQQGSLRICSGTAVNGPSAYYWGAGIVVYKFLTGHLPFDCKDGLTASKAPTFVLSRHKPYWEAYEAILNLQQTWVCPTLFPMCMSLSCVSRPAAICPSTELCKLPCLLKNILLHTVKLCQKSAHSARSIYNSTAKQSLHCALPRQLPQWLSATAGASLQPCRKDRLFYAAPYVGQSQTVQC